MKSQELIAALKQGSQSRFEVAQNELQTVADLEIQITSDLKAERDAGFDEGLAQVAAPGDKQFSLDELNAEVKAAVDPLNAQIMDKNVQIESLQNDLSSAKNQVSELQARVEELQNAPAVPQQPAVDEAAIRADERAAFKAELKAQYEAQQVAETDSETGFKSLLD